MTNFVALVSAAFVFTNTLVTNNYFDVIPGRFTNEITTNWTTTSIEYPVRSASESVYGIYISNTLHQRGSAISNYIAILKWNNRDIPVILESTPIWSGERTIPEPLVNKVISK